MSSGSSDEVAEDYRVALEALTLNSRYEISNLTVIAKENTEHALAISEALRSHIKSTSPQKKLPAFYVLDSVVKNVGTPYTLFFGRQLYSTFMEAYALVDNNVRRKMDEMLKTWKEPVPGSMDTRPVFPPEVTRPIENALIKAKTCFVQAHQEHMRSQQHLMSRGRSIPAAVPPAVPYRDSPTPPNSYRQPQQQLPAFGPNYTAPYTQANGPQYPAPVAASQQFAVPQNGLIYPSTTTARQNTGLSGEQQYSGAPNSQYLTNISQYSGPPNTSQKYTNPPSTSQAYSLPPVRHPSISSADNLLSMQRPPSQQFNPNSSTWQQVSHQGYHTAEDSIDTLNSDIDRLITESKAAWARNMQDATASTRLKALLDLQSILQNHKLPPDQIALIKIQVAQLSEASKAHANIQAPPIPVVAAHVPTAQPTSLDTILGPGALAALLARQTSAPQPAAQLCSPQAPPVQPTYQPSPAATVAVPNADPNVTLLEKLRAAGIISGGSTAPNLNPLSTVSGFPPPPTPYVSTPPNSRAALAEIPNDVVLKPASLKIPRAHLISSLYEKLGVPCTQCGRRFQSDTEGRKKKEVHMDWHFRVRRRMEEAETRGQHRSWYVDELDWIKSREVEDESGGTNIDMTVTATAAATAAPNPKLEYIPVPDDAALANSVCPICQEKFEMKWLDEAQEFVWMDARTISEKIYHASCFADASKDVKSQSQSTPEPSILGKRKAEELDDLVPIRNKIKLEQP